MRFEKGDRVRVAKSVTTEYIGAEGVVASVRRDAEPIFTAYMLMLDDGLKLEFLEYQLDSAMR
jgi:hypothetical protein